MEINLDLVSEYQSTQTAFHKAVEGLKAVRDNISQNGNVIQEVAKRNIAGTEAQVKATKQQIDINNQLAAIVSRVIDNAGAQAQVENIEQLQEKYKELGIDVGKAIQAEKNYGTTGNIILDAKIGELEDVIAKYTELAIAQKQSSDPAEQEKLTAAMEEELKVVEQLTNEIDILNKQGTEKATTSVKGLRGQFEAATFKAFELKQQLGEFAPETQAAVQEAARLKEEIDNVRKSIAAANPEAKFTALTQVASGIAGGFTAVQGALALVGVEGEAVEKSLLKVQAALAISQGLNQLLSVQDGFKNLLSLLGFTRAAKLKDAAATTAQTVSAGAHTGALVAETSATVAATGATNAFTAALLANPFGAILVALTAIITALVLFNDETENEIELNKQLNDLAERRANAYSNLSDIYKRISDQSIQQARIDLERAKASGAPLEEKIRLERALSDQQVDAAQKQANLFKDQIANLDKNILKAEGLRVAYDGLVQVGSDPSILEQKKKELELLDQQNRAAEEALSNIKQQRAEQELLNITLLKRKQENLVTQSKAFIQGQIADVKAGTNQELQLKLQAIDIEKKAKLAVIGEDKDRFAEVFQITQEAERQKRELTNSFLVRRLNDQKAADEGRLAQVKANSREELDLKLKLIDDQLRIELANIELSETKKNALRLQAFKQEQDLFRQFALQKAEMEIDADKQDALRRLALSEEFSIQELQAQKDLIDAEEKSAIVRAENEIRLGKSSQVEIERIQAEARKKREDLDKEALKRTFDFEANIRKANAEIDIALRSAQADNPNIGLAQRRQLRLDVLELEKNAILDERLENEQAKNLGIISEEDFQKKRTELTERETLNRIDIEKEGAKQVSSIWEAVFPNITQGQVESLQFLAQQVDAIISAMFAQSNARIDAQLQKSQETISALDEQISEKESELEEQLDLQKRGLASNVAAKKEEIKQLKDAKDRELANEKRLQQEKEKLAKQQAIVDSAKQVSSLLVAGAEIFAAHGSIPFVGPIIAAGLIAGMIATFLSLKSKTQAAKAETGLRVGDRHGKLSGRRHSQGGELIEAEEGEWFINRKSSREHDPLLESINFGKWDEHSFDSIHGDYKAWNALLKSAGVQGITKTTKELRESKQELKIIEQKEVLMRVEKEKKSENNPLLEEVRGMRQELKELKNRENTYFIEKGKEYIEVIDKPNSRTYKESKE